MVLFGRWRGNHSSLGSASKKEGKMVLTNPSTLLYNSKVGVIPAVFMTFSPLGVSVYREMNPFLRNDYILKKTPKVLFMGWAILS